MDKKAYINPELEVVKIATMQMLAASDPDAPGFPGEDYNGTEDVLSPGLGGLIELDVIGK